MKFTAGSRYSNGVKRSSNALRSNRKGILSNPFVLSSTVGTALGAAHKGYQSFTEYQRMKKRKITPKAKVITARYTGKFRKARKVKYDPFLRNGFIHTTEVNGSVTDPDCVYVAHSTYSGQQLIELLMQVLVKKLFQKAGRFIRDLEELLTGDVNFSTQGVWRINISRINKSTGLTETFFHELLGTDTLLNLCGNVSTGTAPAFVALRDVLADYMVGQSGAIGQAVNVLQPTSMKLYVKDIQAVGPPVVQNYTFRSEINFEEEYVNLKSYSELKIQNRTAAVGGSNDAEDVANNPITGRSYSFRGTPRLRSSHYTASNLDAPLEGISEPSGVLTVRSSQISVGAQQAFKEPPVPKTWWNCVGTTRVVLNPGEIKKDILSHKTKMPLITFLKRAGVGWSPTPFKSLNTIGKSKMYAFEDMINVNAAQNISIAYEADRKVGMYLTTVRNKVSLPYRYSITKNEITP